MKIHSELLDRIAQFYYTSQLDKTEVHFSWLLSLSQIEGIFISAFGCSEKLHHLLNNALPLLPQGTSDAKDSTLAEEYEDICTALPDQVIVNGCLVYRSKICEKNCEEQLIKCVNDIMNLQDETEDKHFVDRESFCLLTLNENVTAKSL